VSSPALRERVQIGSVFFKEVSREALIAPFSAPGSEEFTHMKKFHCIQPQLDLMLGYIDTAAEATRIVHDAASSHSAVWQECVDASRMSCHYNEVGRVEWRSASETMRTKIRRIQFALKNAKDLQEMEQTIEELEAILATADEFIYCAADFLRRRLQMVLSGAGITPDVECHPDNRVRAAVPVMMEAAFPLWQMLGKLVPYMCEGHDEPTRASFGLAHRQAIGARDLIRLHINAQRLKQSRQEPRSTQEILEFGEVVEKRAPVGVYSHH